MFIAYYRVSTKQQGISGLGLESQRDITAHYTSGRGDVVATYTEIETGTAKRERPVLREAIEECKRRGAILVVAKLDRLARNVAFTSALMESGIDFVACDMPDANRFMIHIMAAMAEYEAQLISERTKAALAASTKKLGGYRGTYTRRESRRTLPAALVRQMQQLREDGCSLQEIADRVNDQGHRSSRGSLFSKVAVSRTLQREAA